VGWRRPAISEDSSGIKMWTSLFLLDLARDDRIIGWGEVCYDLLSNNPFFKGKPYADRVKTNDEFRKKGYDIRRLVVMNALASVFFDRPLYSSDQFLRLYKTDDPNVRPHELSWRRLVQAGLAEVLPISKTKNRYAFVKYPGVSTTRILLDELKRRKTGE